MDGGLEPYSPRTSVSFDTRKIFDLKPVLVCGMLDLRSINL